MVVSVPDVGKSAVIDFIARSLKCKNVNSVESNDPAMINKSYQRIS